MSTGTTNKQYPTNIDTFATWQDDVDIIIASNVNDVQDQIVVIESTLGTNPQGSTQSVKSRLSVSVNDDGTLKNNSVGQNQIADSSITTTKLAVGTSLTIMSSLSDKGYSGIKFNAIVGENVISGNVLYIKNDGKYWKSNAIDVLTIPCVVLSMVNGESNTAQDLLLIGFFNDSSWNWTVGGLLYVSTTSGMMTQDLNSFTKGQQVQTIGYACTPTTIYFKPDFNYIEIA